MTTQAANARGEPIVVVLDTANSPHASLLEQGDVIQCLDCGAWTWTTEGLESLNAQECEPDEPPFSEDPNG